MDIERALVSKLARTQSMEAVMSRQLEASHFTQRRKGDTTDPNEYPLAADVYGWMLGHLSKYKSVPSEAITRARWPRFEFVDSTDTLEALVDHFVGHVKRQAGFVGVRQLAAIVDDPSKWNDLEVHAFAVAADIARSVPASNITRLSDSIHRLRLHREKQRTGAVSGITLVGPDLDDLTYGIQPGEFMVWEGFLGAGKSTMTMVQIANEYIHRGHTGLVISLEMDGDKMAHRWDAAMAGFRYRALKFMEMRDEDYDAWARFAERAHESRFEKDVLVVDDVYNCTPERVFTEVERWRPDMFVVDTIDEVRAPAYLKSFWERQAHAARELKAVCRATKIPGVGVAQAGRDAEEQGATLGNMAGSIDIGRKADLVVGLHATPEMKRNKMIELRMLKNRDGEGDGLRYTYFRDPATLELRPWRATDAVPTKSVQV